MGKAEDRKTQRPRSRKKLGLAVHTTIKVRGEFVMISFEVHRRDFPAFMNRVTRDLYDSGSLPPDFPMIELNDHVANLAACGADGRPKEYDDIELLERYEQFLASRRNPAHGVREFARRMGADTDKKVRAIAQALREARKRVAEN